MGGCCPMGWGWGIPYTEKKGVELLQNTKEQQMLSNVWPTKAYRSLGT